MVVTVGYCLGLLISIFLMLKVLNSRLRKNK